MLDGMQGANCWGRNEGSPEAGGQHHCIRQARVRQPTPLPSGGRSAPPFETRPLASSASDLLASLASGGAGKETTVFSSWASWASKAAKSASMLAAIVRLSDEGQTAFGFPPRGSFGNALDQPTPGRWLNELVNNWVGRGSPITLARSAHVQNPMDARYRWQPRFSIFFTGLFNMSRPCS